MSNTDLNDWRKSGGKIKYGKTKRAKGSEDILYYSLPPDIAPIVKKKSLIPSHFGRSNPEWLNQTEVMGLPLDGSQ